MDNIEKLKYPIGKFKHPGVIQNTHLDSWIKSVETLPERLEKVVSGLSKEELKLPYRPDGWNVAEVVHHIPDSHVNAYIRLKWTLTEQEPVIKTYNENNWTALYDAQNADVRLSLDLLKSLHSRWVYLLKNLTPEELTKTYYHPDDKEIVPVAEMIGRYAWHGEHHYAHILQALERKG